MTQVDAHHSAGRRALDWLLRDRKTGRRTVAQWPNAPLLLFVLCRLAAWPLSGRAEQALQWAGSAALAWWAIDEVARGVNPFRRMLGAIVLVAVVVGSVSALSR